MPVQNRFTPLRVTVPNLTPVTAPITANLDLGDCILNTVYLRIPPGPSGLVGVNINQAGTQIWPWSESTDWVVGDDEHYKVPVGVEIDQGVTINAYNLDTFTHTMYFYFLYTPISLAGPSFVPPVIVAIS